MNLLFVYGTLKEGHGRNHLLNGQRYLGVARTSSRYQMVSLGSYPALIMPEGKGHGVWGELYEVDDACMEILDQVEGVAQNLYSRARIFLKKIQLVCLPLDQGVFDAIQDKQAVGYLYQRQVEDAPNCGEFWPKY